MIIENELHYTSKHTFAELKEALDGDDKDKVMELFKERVKELYLEPARLLIEHAKYCKNNMGFLFSAGLICVSTIDFLSRFYAGCPENKVRERFVDWISVYMKPHFDKKLATKFYEDFRNGLVHECRIKNGGEFTLRSEEVIYIVDQKYLRVNPRNLLYLVYEGFEEYVNDIKNDEVLYEELKNCLMKDFENDFGKGDDTNER